jgi:hypothetical protein
MPEPLDPLRDASSRSMIRTDTPFAAKESARIKPVGPAPTLLNPQLALIRNPSGDSRSEPPMCSMSCVGFDVGVF